MSIIINGKVMGKILGEDANSNQEIDDVKDILASDIKRISIDSGIANVNVSCHEGNHVIAHLYGSVISNSIISLQMSKVRDEIKVSVINSNNPGMNSTSSTFIVSSLTLDVKLPAKAFEELFVQGRNSNINILSGVHANIMDINSKNGNVNVESACPFLNIECANGNIEVDAAAKSNIRLAVQSKNGNVIVRLSNISSSDVSVVSKNGYSKNCPKLSGDYTVSGHISSKNGNVTFK